MAFDFTDSPTIGTQNTLTVGGAVLVWDGQKWTAAPNSATGGGGSFGSGTVTSITAGVGLSGGVITASGTISLANTSVSPGAYTLANITVDAQGRIVAAASGSVPTATAPVFVGDSPPVLSNGTLWFDGATTQLYVGYVDPTGSEWVAATNNGGPVTYAQLPAEVQQVPISFPFSGKPPASGVVNVPMPWAITVPPTLAGTVVYAGTNASATTTFTLNRISGGSTIALGTIAKTSASAVSCTLAGTGGTLAVGDVLQIATPAQDATLADFGVSVLCYRT